MPHGWRGGFVHRGTITRAIREIMQNARALEQPRGLVDEGMQMITPTRGVGGQASFSLSSLCPSIRVEILRAFRAQCICELAVQPKEGWKCGVSSSPPGNLILEFAV